MTLEALLNDQVPARKSAQRMRWFVEAFEAQVAETSRTTETIFEIDQIALAEVFADWIKSFEYQKPPNDDDNTAYVGFAAGLMLKSLILASPVMVISNPADADKATPAYFWPEGHLYVQFCLNVRALVLEKDFNTKQRSGEALGEISTWWSFRENVSEDPSYAISFLDLFVGQSPEWVAPQFFRKGQEN